MLTFDQAFRLSRQPLPVGTLSLVGLTLAGAVFQISSGAEGPLTRTSDDRDPDIVVPLNLVEMM